MRTQKIKYHTPEPNVDEKYCAVCKEVKPADAFHRNKSTKHGLSSYCKACKRAQDQCRRATPRGKTMAYVNQKIWNEDHRKKRRAINRKSTARYRQKNLELIREKARQRYYAQKYEALAKLLSAHPQTLWEKYAQRQAT